ncbi:MAG: hypothetical protein AB4372_21335 [Xenococcus sp. (in: cyanobacteria)]
MDNWNILLENAEDGSTVATVLEVPNLQTSDKTKQGAVEKVKKLLQERLAKAEIVQISITTESISSENPLMKFAEIFKDDTDFEDIMSVLKAERANESEV